ncbi:hypothetical protein V493_05279 [Pseudogymnoascus sp. VKM F-4281 (FW-2241)]|nr:hypothetical protein V493_05279 [Pseudogymnoascus sp. VKM F-4281 (FW-2241)]
MESVDTIQKHFSLSTEAINELTSFKTLSGRYSTDGCVQEDRITIVPVEQAMRASQEQQQEIIRFRTDNALNFMASCALPYYDRQKRAMDYGVSCAGDQLPIDETVIRGIELRFAYMARDKAYTKEGFLKHFILCREAQLLWESSKEGSIAPPEFPQVAKDGGYSKLQETPIAIMSNSDVPNELPQPKIISMTVDGDYFCESEYRLQIGKQMKYLVINPGTYDRDTLSFPLADLPPLQYDKWTVAHIPRPQSQSGYLHTSYSPRKLSSVEGTWHPTTIDYFNPERIEQLTALAYEATPSPALASTLGTSPPIIAKIIRFVWGTPPLEQETEIYRLLEGYGLASRFLGHIREGGGVIGFLVKDITGRVAGVEDLQV